MMLVLKKVERRQRRKSASNTVEMENGKCSELREDRYKKMIIIQPDHFLRCAGLEKWHLFWNVEQVYGTYV